MNCAACGGSLPSDRAECPRCYPPEVQGAPARPPAFLESKIRKVRHTIYAGFFIFPWITMPLAAQEAGYILREHRDQLIIHPQLESDVRRLRRTAIILAVLAYVLGVVLTVAEWKTPL